MVFCQELGAVICRKTEELEASRNTVSALALFECRIQVDHDYEPEAYEGYNIFDDH